MPGKHLRSLTLTAAVAALLACGIAVSQEEKATRSGQPAAVNETTPESGSDSTQRTAMDGQEQVNEARDVVMQMKKDPRLVNLLERAQGVFLVPDFGKVAVGVGGRGGEGVLLLKRNGQWSGPAFYNFGRVSAGLQAGLASGSVAMLLMTQDAVQPFTAQENNFTLDAAAGLTIVDYSVSAREAAEEPDVVMWSDTEGLFGGISIGVSGFTRDEDENRAYYSKEADVQEIFSGAIKNPQADSLKDSLPAQTASRQ